MYSRIGNSRLKHLDFMLLDGVLFELAFFAAYQFRLNPILAEQARLYRNSVVAVALFHVVYILLFQPYGNILRRSNADELTCALKQSLGVIVALVVYLFLVKEGGDYSRLTVVLWFLLSWLFLYFGRTGWKYVLNHRKVRRVFQRSLIVVTSRERAEETLQRLQANLYADVSVSGLVLVDALAVGTQIQGVPVVTSIADLQAYLKQHWVDEMFVDLQPEWAINQRISDMCQKMGITAHLKLTNEMGKREFVENFGGFVVLSHTMNSTSPVALFFKRMTDIVGAIVGLIITAVCTIFVAPAIYIASPGPIFFSQVRVGKNGRKFKIYKFRSMYVDAEARKEELLKRNQMKGLMFKLDADPRIIGSGDDGRHRGIGWFIRKFSIDELPQFWNVLKGDMSLVGTRPPTVEEWARYELHHHRRLATKPGLTGMWQVNGRNDVTDFEDVVRLDTEYIYHWSLLLDIKILLKTILVVLRGSGAK